VKEPGGREILDRLIAQADVFVQNLAPDAARRLGIDAAHLTAVHERLISCDISGYGPGGPFSDRKAYDLLIQCESGLVSITGTPDTPSKAGISVADIAAGMYAAQRHPGHALRPCPHRAGPGRRGVHARGAGRVDGLSVSLHPLRRQRTAASRREPCHHRAVRPGSDRDGSDGERRPAERTGVGRVLRGRPAPARPGLRPTIPGQRRAGRQHRGPERDHLRRVRPAALRHLPPVTAGWDPVLGAVPALGEHDDDVLAWLAAAELASER
jgi:hypothetical protein